MATINANMNASVGWIPLTEAAALAFLPGFYRLDSEYIEVGGLHLTDTGKPWSPPNGRWVARGFAGSSKASHTSGATLTRYYPDAPGGGGSQTLAQVLAQGNDTGGTSIVHAPAVDVAANTSLSATATGTSTANADTYAYTDTADSTSDTFAIVQVAGIASSSRTVATASGDAHADTSVASSGGGGAATADVVLNSTDDASALTTAASSGAGTVDVHRSGGSQGGDVTADSLAQTNGAGIARAVSTAIAAGGSASIGPVADATRAEIQVNGLPLYTTAAAGPPGTFVSLFYVDSTAVSGGTWLWNFVTGAYVRIAGVF